LSDFQSESGVRFVESGADLETRPPKHRRYTASFKLRFIELADACSAPGELASLLRKEDTIVITETGMEVLTGEVPIELDGVEVLMGG
jgi:hypothetical protein